MQNNTELHDLTLRVMNNVGLKPDPWQIDVITGDHQRLLLNRSRQAGKTSVVAVLGLVEAMIRPMTRILLLSRSLRQSREMFRLMVYYHRMMKSIALKHQTAEELGFNNDSRIVCMPCREETIRERQRIRLPHCLAGRLRIGAIPRIDANVGDVSVVHVRMPVPLASAEGLTFVAATAETFAQEAWHGHANVPPPRNVSVVALSPARLARWLRLRQCAITMSKIWDGGQTDFFM